MLSDGEMSYLYDGFGRLEQVTKADGSFQKNHYEYDAFGNTVSCEEQVHNRFRYTGEQYDPLTGQYYLRARYYNPVIARFTQEDTYYGDGLNLYTYCQNNPILYHDPTGHGTKENSPYSRNEQRYIDAGADPDTARLAAQCYPDAKSKQDLYNKYKKQGYSAQDAKKLANREIIHGEEATKKYIKDNNVKKSGPDYTATSPRDNVNTDWRTQERVNAQRNAGAGKGNESGNKSGSVTKPNQVHHYATNKSKTYTPQLEEIANRYELDLDDAWNKDLLPHQGRHPNAYHEYVLDSMKQFDNIAQGDKDIFLKLFDNLKNNVKSKPDMLYKDYWK